MQNAQDIKGDLTAPVQGKPKQGVGAYASKDIRSKGSEKPDMLDYAARAGRRAGHAPTPRHSDTPPCAMSHRQIGQRRPLAARSVPTR